MKFVPTVPAKPAVVTAPFTSASIDYERYVLRALEYQGDLYEERILQKEGYSSQDGVVVQHVFDQGQADRDIEWYRRKMAAQKAAGKVVETWLSPEIGKPGHGGH